MPSGSTRYEIRRTLGHDRSRTEVYEAFDREKERLVALEYLPRETVEEIRRGREAFAAWQGAGHRNLVEVYEMVANRDVIFFTRELVQGQGIVAYARPAGEEGFDEAKLRDGFLQLARGLVALHENGGVHGSIEPVSVQVTDEGRVVVMPPLFGFTLATQPTGESRPPRYLAPELMRDAPMAPACDWYGVGTLLYEALTGENAFSGNMFQVVKAKAKAPPDPRTRTTHCPHDLAGLAIALLRPEPASRPDGASVVQMLTGVS